MPNLRILTIGLLATLNLIQAGDQTPSPRPHTSPPNLDSTPAEIRAMIAAINRMGLTAEAGTRPDAPIAPVARRTGFTYNHLTAETNTTADIEMDYPIYQVARNTNPEGLMELFEAATEIDSKTDLRDTFGAPVNFNSPENEGSFFEALPAAINFAERLNARLQLIQDSQSTTTRSRASSGEYRTPERPTRGQNRLRTYSFDDSAPTSSPEDSPIIRRTVRRRLITEADQINN